MYNDLLIALQSTRPDYGSEGRLHRLYLDCYTGTGGFGGDRLNRTFIPYWSSSSYDYGDWWAGNDGPPVAPDSYLHQFRAEDPRDYTDRVRTSFYRNPIKPIVEGFHAYLTQQDANRSGYMPPVAAWFENVDRRGRHIADLGKDALLRAQTCARTFTMVEPPGPGEAVPRAFNLWPQQVLDYSLDAQDQLVGLKYSVVYEKRAGMLEPRRKIRRYVIWELDKWSWYDVEGSEILDQATGPNLMGRVPCSILTWHQPVDAPGAAAGVSQLDTLAPMAVALFNRDSEYDTHLRRSNFAQLVVPGTQGDVNRGVVAVGDGNALVENDLSKGISRYIAPPPHIATAYAARCEEILNSIYRNAMADRGDATRHETAQARRLRFAQTNALLASVARNLDRWEMSVAADAARAMGVRDAGEARSKRPDEFNIEDLAESMARAKDALSLPLGQTGAAYVVKAAFRTVVSDLSSSEKARVEREIDAAVAMDKRWSGVPVAGTGEATDDASREGPGKGASWWQGTESAPKGWGGGEG
jgi:hypothetical protein